MKQFIITAIAAIGCIFTHAQVKPDKVLYGIITTDSLKQEPYSKWFNKNYNDFNPNIDVQKQFQLLQQKDISIEVFFGTWCGDSKREVPRFLKLLNTLNFDKTKLKLVAVGDSDSLYKQSPTNEHNGKGIFKVPTFIISKNGKEVNRITEFPLFSLERDYAEILAGNNYQSNYKSYPYLSKWMQTGILADTNIAPRSLALQLKHIVSGENELNAAGYVLLKQGFKKEAVTVFRMNANLFPESANIFSSLGEGYLRYGEKEKAVIALEQSIALNKEPTFLKEILQLLYEAKGVK